MAELLLIERRGPAAIVTLNRPDKQNALSAAVLEAIDRELEILGADATVRGVVLTGNQKVFSTGGDLKEALEIKDIRDTTVWLEKFRRANERIESVGKPVLAAINGYCVTGGLELALCCDIRIAGTGSQFGITSSRIGTVAGAGGPARLARLVGPSWAKEMLFSGNFIDADTALHIGLINELVAPEEVMAKALARIDVYAQRAPLAIGYAKMAVNTGLQMGLESALHYERQLTTTLFTTEDKREGMAAFLEKRAAGFKGL